MTSAGIVGRQPSPLLAAPTHGPPARALPCGCEPVRVCVFLWWWVWAVRAPRSINLKKLDEHTNIVGLAQDILDHCELIHVSKMGRLIGGWGPRLWISTGRCAVLGLGGVLVCGCIPLPPSFRGACAAGVSAPCGMSCAACAGHVRVCRAVCVPAAGCTFCIRAAPPPRPLSSKTHVPLLSASWSLVSAQRHHPPSWLAAVPHPRAVCPVPASRNPLRPPAADGGGNRQACGRRGCGSACRRGVRSAVLPARVLCIA
jgi:hypothetical protein